MVKWLKYESPSLALDIFVRGGKSEGNQGNYKKIGTLLNASDEF